MKLSLPEGLKAEIAAQARQAFPRECCGLIEGIRAGETIQAVVLHPARNLAEASDRFEIDPQDHFAALKRARARGRAVIGCYHSHPGGKPEPSARDRQGAREDGFLWLIAALGEERGPVAFGVFSYSASEASFLSAHISGRPGANLVALSGKPRT